MATFGTSHALDWSYFDTEVTIPITASEGETVYLVIFAFKPIPEAMDSFAGWDDEGPWALPAGWVNVLDEEDAFACLLGDELIFVGGAYRAVFVYRYDGIGVPDEVVISVVYGGQYTVGVTFGVTLEEGEEMVDFGFVGVEEPEPEDVLTMPGSADAAGKRIVIVNELIVSGGIL